MYSLERLVVVAGDHGLQKQVFSHAISFLKIVKLIVFIIQALELMKLDVGREEFCRVLESDSLSVR